MPYLLKISSCLNNCLLSLNSLGRCKLELQVLNLWYVIFCGGEYGNGECEASVVAQSYVEQVNYIANSPRQQFNPFSNTYNPRQRNNPNFSQSNQGAQKNFNAPFQAPPTQPPTQSKPSTLEITLEKLCHTTTSFIQQTFSFMQQIRSNFKN